ncbi:MAG TPA: TM2 domain-containing protein [Candidatus Saccharimonadales bacterium]|nr:TM2 domain-containing protein [Candidatus Saccharimonadales bacterium]
MDNTNTPTNNITKPPEVIAAEGTPAPNAVARPPEVVVNKQRHFLAVFFISFMWGTFGIDRFYLGKIWTGILKLLTFGGFGLWTIIDLVLIMSGSMRDKQGNEMLEAARYKKFASRTVLIFALVFGATILIVGVISVYEITQFIQGGGIQNLQNLIPSGNQMPDLNQLQNINL